MSRSHLIVYLLILAAASVGPFVYRSLFVHAPERAQLAQRLQASEERMATERAQLAARIDDSEARQDDLSGSIAALRAERRAAATAAEESAERWARTRARHGELDARRSPLQSRLDHAQEEARLAHVELSEAERQNSGLDAAVVALREELQRLDDEIDRSTRETLALATERAAWEQSESLSRVPRMSLQGLLGYNSDGLCRGAELGLWLLRPYDQRIGLKTALLVDDRENHDEHGYVGASWQTALTRRAYVDLWAGPHWSTDPGRTAIDPAAGVTVGFAVPRLRLSLGVTGMAAPDRSLVGLSLGINEVGRQVEVYPRR